MSKETKARVGNAFRAMKDLGISEAKVKPVLKSLLKLYDKNWELIESENYRALADAIFEREEAEEKESSKKTVNSEAAAHSKKTTVDGLEEQAQAAEESGRPLKRLRHKYQDGQSSASAAATATVPRMPLIMPKDEPTELPEVNTLQDERTEPQLLRNNKGKQPISPLPLVAHEVCDPIQPSGVSTSHAMNLRDRGKESVFPQTSSGEKRSLPDSSPQVPRAKEWKVVRGTVPAPKQKRAANYPLIIPKDEPVTDDLPQLAVPLAVIRPEPYGGGESPDRNGSVRELPCFEPSSSPSMNEKEKTDGTVTPNLAIPSGEFAVTSGQHASNLEIASSPLGEVKISLICNLGLLRPDFDMPSIERLLQLVEEKYLKSYKTLDPGFSLMNIMKDICQCVLSLRSDQNDEGPETVNAHPSPTIKLPSKVSVTDDLGAGGLHLSSVVGANDLQSDTELNQPKTPLVTPCNGTDGACHLEEGDRGDNYQTHIEKKEIHAEETNGMSLVVVDQSHVTPEMIRPLHDIFDIAKGQEKLVITLVNEVNNESPPSFNYIRQNVVFQNAHVNFSLAHIGDNSCCSACFGNCLSSSAPCVCAHAVGGSFAYTTDGLVTKELLEECISMKRDPKKHSQIFCKECPVERSKSIDILEPCKGHLVRKFIKECWLRCGCNKHCGNRVVQRGITRRLQVFMTPEGKGWGLRTLEDLPQGAFVCELIGEILTTSEYYRRILRSPKRDNHSYPVILDAHWDGTEVLKDEKALCLDATNYGNIARFINHRCYDSNLVEIPVEVETSDRHYYRLALFTSRKIMAMEELTWDYGIDFDDDDQPIKAFLCECGSKFCRNIRRSRTRGASSLRLQ